MKLNYKISDIKFMNKFLILETKEIVILKRKSFFSFKNQFETEIQEYIFQNFFQKVFFPFFVNLQVSFRFNMIEYACTLIIIQRNNAQL